MLNIKTHFKTLIAIKVLERKFLKDYISSFSEDVSLSEVSDEDLVKMCDNSLTRYYYYSNVFTKEFLGAVLIVCGIGTGATSLALSILDRLVLYPNNYSTDMGIAAAFFTVIGKYIKYKEKPQDELMRELKDIIIQNDKEIDDKIDLR